MHILHSPTTDPNRELYFTPLAGSDTTLLSLGGGRKLFPGNSSANEKKKPLSFKLTVSFSGLFVYNFPFSSIEEFPVLSLLDLHVVCHSCVSQITVVCCC